MMTELFLFGQTLPGSESGLLERIRECAAKRNRGASQATAAIQSMPADRIKQIVVGSNHIAFLLTDFRVARLSFEIITNVVEPTIPIDKSNDNGPSGSSTSGGAGGSAPSDAATAAAAAAAAAANAANRTAKIRRIMMARPGVRSGGFCRTGVIIDRNRSNRPVIPASAVPEDRIVQCQVVLQGKSREVIVRELQRTNLNVNEAVNNLLSRDDDEVEDLDETSEAYLHEELLSLLDAGLRSDSGGAAAILDHENIYSSPDGYEYVIPRDLARRREEAKGKEPNKEGGESGQQLQEQFVFGEALQIWGGSTETETHFQFPPGVDKFIKIASTHSELLALADDGQVYGWKWERGKMPENIPHSANLLLLPPSSDSDRKMAEKMVDIESCGLRATFSTQNGLVGSFMDASCGRKMADALNEAPLEIPGETVEKLFATSTFSAVLTTSGNLYWRGVYPFNERRKLWEKVRSKKKQVANTNAEIVVGSEVRTKSAPIYSVGSVAVNFSGGLPMIGTLFEDAWTLNECCRFRVQTPEAYDQSPAGSSASTDKEKGQREKRVSFSLAVGNRKRAAPASDELAEGNETAQSAGSSSASVAPAQHTQSKESAWAIKDVLFIHEEAMNDVSVVKIVDGAYCGVVFKSTLERVEKEGMDPVSFDFAKLGIRLMRKDDLVAIPPSSKLGIAAARSPDNFQSQWKQIRLPMSVKRIISLAIDGTGFRILCEKRSRVHLLRVSTIGKLLSDHSLPLNLDALCHSPDGSDQQTQPTLNNFGDESILLLRDSVGAFQPLLRNAAGGFQELAFTGVGKSYRFGLGMRYFKSPNEVNGATVCTEPNSVGRNGKGQSSKNANRMLLMVALISPTPYSTSPAIPSLAQAVLNCDVDSVREILNQLEGAELELCKEMACERIEGNRNIFHAAVMGSFAKTNRDQADVETGNGDDQTKGKWAIDAKLDSREAEAARTRYDHKWQEMLGSAPTTRAKAHQQAKEAAKESAAIGTTSSSNADPIKDSIESSPSKEKPTEEGAVSTSSPSETPAKCKNIPTAPKERQANAIEIVRQLCKSTALQEFFLELMRSVDVNGQTPFQCAINFRAYSAAHLLWETTANLHDWNQDVAEILTPAQQEDSALFLLCANDCCSYTWTGEEHTTQDIFECRTCGLTGTLCCCTECALTCHRNHDCKPKRTSPTAYCDCWEKYDCKALVTGNTAKREQLLQLMLQNSKLIGQLNSRGEHLLLFLVRTVGRQLIEQESFVKRSKRPGPGTTVTSSGLRIPEHDLEPPKFARKALELALSNWEAVKSLLEVGIKKHTALEVPISEREFHLGEQHGSTHLDKFVFTLLAYCEESSLDILLNLFIRQANHKSAKDPEAEVHQLISRFVRSVTRLFILILLLSPSAIGTLLCTVSESINNAFAQSSSCEVPLQQSLSSPQLALSSSVSASAQETPTTSIRESLQNYRAVAISGMLSLVRASLPGLTGSTFGSATDKKDAKKRSVVSFVTKCRRIFQTLLSYSLNELIGVTETLISPLRNGILKPTTTNTLIASDNVLELIQQHLSSEQDLSTLLKEVSQGTNGGSGNLANLMTGNNRIKKLVELRNAEMRPSGGVGNDEVTDQPSPSEDDLSNDDEEDDDDGLPNQAFSRARENSSTSLDNTTRTRERTVSGGGRRERQDTMASAGTVMDEEGQAEDVQMMGEDVEHDEDEDASDHDMDEEEEPYFDVHDDDDDEDDDDGSDDSDENPSDAEGGDSNDTATVAIGGEENSQADGGTATIPLSTDGSTAAATTAASANSRPTNNNNGGGGVTSTAAVTGTTGTTTTAAGREQPRGPAWAQSGITSTSGESATERVPSSARHQWRTSSSANGATTVTSSSAAPTTNQPAASAPSANPATGVSDAAVDVVMEDSQFSTSNTGTQLALCFSVLVKLIDELLVQLLLHAKWRQQLGTKGRGITILLDLEPELFSASKNLFSELLEPTWDWLYLILDRTEAQLKYSQAISKSLVGPLTSTSPDREEQARQEGAELGQQRPKSATSGDHRRYKKRSSGTTKRTNASGSAGAESDEASAQRAEVLSYFLSLLRSHSAENGDDLPVLEYNALRNVCFVTEAYFFHIMFNDQLKQLEVESKIAPREPQNETPMEVDGEGAEIRDESQLHRLRRFYQRSQSISYPLLSTTATQHHAFTFNAADAIPLSTRSHLLSADAERDSLFAHPTPTRSRAAHKEIASDHGIKYPTHQSLSQPQLKYAELLQRLPSQNLQKQRSSSSVIVKHYSGGEATAEVHQQPEKTNGISAILLSARFGLEGTTQRFLGRWAETITMFTRTFHEDLTNRLGGDSSHSVLLNKTGVCSFAVRHAQFRRQMDKLKSAQTKDLIFSQVSREKYTLIQQTFRQLNQMFVKRQSGTSSATGTPAQAADQQQTPPLTSHKVKVTFRDEPGEGTGVARSFYAALADALTTMKHLPALDNVNEDGTNRPNDATNSFGRPAKSASTDSAKKAKTSGGAKNATTSKEGTVGVTAVVSQPDSQSLFYRASRTGFFAPIAGSNSPQRLNAFRNVGRLIGICLQHMELIPLPLCRHVLKFVLSHPFNWFDLAFFDPSLFDSLRSIVYNEERDEYHPSEFYEQLEMTFSVDLPAEEGGGTMELKPDGANIAVTRDNVLEYIYLFVENRLLGPHKPALEAIRRGVLDVISADSLANLTSEDLRLILCGTQEISMSSLQNFTKFLDESSSPAEVLAKYKRTFWQVVNRLTAAEKQDLCFFWTGSPSLPSTEEGFQPLPTIMIRPADDQHLPTANTCISRLYLPIYSSRRLLKDKLCLAIKARNFGFV